MSDQNLFYQQLEEQSDADYVKVVRCKDCKWHEDEEPSMVWCPIIVGSWGSEDGYCWWGERGDG